MQTNEANFERLKQEFVSETAYLRPVEGNFGWRIVQYIRYAFNRSYNFFKLGTFALDEQAKIIVNKYVLQIDPSNIDDKSKEVIANIVNLAEQILGTSSEALKKLKNLTGGATDTNPAAVTTVVPTVLSTSGGPTKNLMPPPVSTIPSPLPPQVWKHSQPPGSFSERLMKNFGDRDDPPIRALDKILTEVDAEKLDRDVFKDTVIERFDAWVKANLEPTKFSWRIMLENCFEIAAATEPMMPKKPTAQNIAGIGAFGKKVLEQFVLPVSLAPNAQALVDALAKNVISNKNAAKGTFRPTVVEQFKKDLRQLGIIDTSPHFQKAMRALDSAFIKASKSK